MTIDADIFWPAMRTLFTHFDWHLTETVGDIWKEYLDEIATTEEFYEAFRTILLESDYLLSAKEIGDLIEEQKAGTSKTSKPTRTELTKLVTHAKDSELYTPEPRGTD